MNPPLGTLSERRQCAQFVPTWDQPVNLVVRPLADCHYPTIELRLRPGSHRSRYALLRVKINQPDAASRVYGMQSGPGGGVACGLKDHRIPRYHPLVLTMSERRFPQMSLCACAYNTSETHTRDIL